MNHSKSLGVDANIIEVETFDELLADVMRLVPDVPDEVASLLHDRALRAAPATIPGSSGRWPVLRLNALPAFTFPTVCRRVTCDIGGSKEVQDAVETSSADVIAVRRSLGVLAFGSDSEIRKAFGSFGARDWDVHAIETRRLRYDSPDQGLLYSALARAISRERPVLTRRRRGSYFMIVDRARANDDAFKTLLKETSRLTGTVPGINVEWAEAVRIKMDYRLEQLWLLLEPTVWVERANLDPAGVFTSAEFVRDRLSRRYNSKWHALLDAWIQVIVGDGEETELRAFGIGDGLDAVFTIGKVTAYSRRETPN